MAVSADGQRTVGGTYNHTYSAQQARREDVAGFVSAASPTASGDDGTYGTYCYGPTGALLWSSTFSGWQGVYWVAISSDGSKVASGGFMTQTPQAGFVQAFDGATGNMLLNYATKLRVNQVALSADGTWLVSAAESLLLFKFNATTGVYDKADEFVPPDGGDATNAVITLGISDDGSTIVFADYAAAISLVSNTGGVLTLKQTFSVPSSFCHMVALTPDGTAFAAGGASGTFYLFNVARFLTDATPTYSYSTGISGPVYSVAVASSGTVFVGVVNSGSSAGYVYVVEIIDFACSLQAKFATSRNPNFASLDIATGQLAVADGHPDGTPGNFYLYDGITNTGLPIVQPELSWQYGTTNMSWPIKISGNGKVVVAGSDDSYIYYFTA